MIKKEFDKLSNNEKLIIIYWRVYATPRVLSADEIAKILYLDYQFVLDTIKKFQHNVRLKLELEAFKNNISSFFRSNKY